MKVPLSWLKEFIDTGCNPAQIASLLTSAGLEVDDVETASTELDTRTKKENQDAIFEISLTPNLGHCSCILGVARELSALTSRPVTMPKVQFKESSQPVEKSAKISVEDKNGCLRYACRVFKNVTIKPSPEWLQKWLTASGVRPINNVVDITNFVMIETNQPMHAFDYDKLDGHEIIVRSAKDGERFITLDDKERLLQAGDVMICDKKQSVAVGGIMGGQNTEISDGTKNVLLEAACFNPGTIRKTSKRLGLQTDGSRRHERGIDPNGMRPALDRAAMLLQELAGAEVLSGILDSHPEPFPEKVIKCRLSRTNLILGTHLSVSEVEAIFKRLQFASKWDGQDAFSIAVPTYRTDIGAEIDLIEEIARIYGYNNIEKRAVPYRPSTLPHNPIFVFEGELRTRLVAEGLQEFITCDLIGPTLSAIVKEHLMPEEAIVRVLNPTSVEQSILRTSLLPGLLQLVKYNIDHQNLDVSGFEIGRIHFKEGEQYREESVVGIVLSGKAHPHYWDEKPRDVDFFDLKGIVENLLAGFEIENAVFKPSKFDAFHTSRQASIFVNDLEIGSMGEIHPTIMRRLDTTQRIFFAELSLHDLLAVRKKRQKMDPLPLYPCSERDWTVPLREEVPIEKIFASVKSAASPLLESCSLIDIYRSDKLGHGLKNVTLRFVYRDRAKTVEQPVVDSEHARITSAVQQALVK